MRITKDISNQILYRIVSRILKKNKFKSGVLVLSIVLVSVLLTVMFGAGVSIVKDIEQANIRTEGTLANGFLLRATSQDMVDVSNLDEVSRVGFQQYVAELNLSEKLANNYFIAITYYDDTEWNKNIVPTLSNIKGNYPKSINEIMLSIWTLEKLEIDDPELGMMIPISFTTLDGSKIEYEFILSGYYVDYIYNSEGTPKSGNTTAANLYYSTQSSSRRAAGNAIVSEIFANTYGLKEGILGTCLIDKNIDAEQVLDLLYQTTGRNDFIVSGLNNNIQAVRQAKPIIIILVLFVLLNLICGYLLIYNIVNISLLQDLHMYGQLKTLGASEKQLKCIVNVQSNIVSVLGIPIGVVLGTIISNWIIPILLEKVMTGSGFGEALTYDVKVSPLIYLFTVFFAYLTVRISNHKAALFAANVSPSEALKYIDVCENIKEYRNNKGNKLCHMAYRNVFRNRSRAKVTIWALFFGLLLYIIICTCIYNIDYEEKFKREIPYNFIIKNLTFQNGDIESIEDVFNSEVVSKIQTWEGVQEIEIEYVHYVEVSEAQEYLTPYIEKKAYSYEEQKNTTLEAMLVGLSNNKFEDFGYKSTLGKEEIDKYLENGTGIFIEDADGVDYKVISGKKITFANYSDSSKTVTYKILGVLVDNQISNEYEKNYNLYGSDYWGAVKGFTSYQGIEKLGQDLVIHALRIHSDTKYDNEIRQKLNLLFSNTDSVEINSQIEVKESVDEAIMVIKISGKVISMFMLVMGLFNFINVIFASIYSRKKELAILESIGMTKKQLKGVLVLEGMYYGFITLGLLLTVGLAISYIVYRFVKNIIYFLAFGIPIESLIVLIVLIILICLFTPLIAFNSITKESIIERIRKGIN